MYSDDFERWWKDNKDDILHNDADYQRVLNSYKIKSGADLLLFAIPVVSGIVSMKYIPVDNELIKWLISAVITILIFLLCVWVKSTTIHGETLSDIEERLKGKYADLYNKN